MSILLIGGSGFVGSRLIEQIGIKHCHNLDKKVSELFPEIGIIADIREKTFNKLFPDNIKTIVLLAAEHRDDVSPTSLYYDVNLQGTKNVLEAMDNAGVKNIIFTSSVAVYGLNKNNPKEDHQADPFNHYGKSKWLAEEALREWYQKNPDEKSLTIIRPTVIFGERNRGNVYNLLKQISSGKFLMVGKGINYKSMAYVGNVAAFIKYHLEHLKPGYKVFNYVDKPDINMNELVSQIETSLNKTIPSIHFPYWLGMLGGYGFDILSYLSGKKFAINSIRVKKFCATTRFDSTAAHNCGFQAPYSLSQGLHNTLLYEFIEPHNDGVTFISE